MGTSCSCVDNNKSRNELMINSELYNMESKRNNNLHKINKNIIENKKKSLKKNFNDKNLSFYNFMGDKITEESVSNNDLKENLHKKKIMDSELF